MGSSDRLLCAINRVATKVLLILEWRHRVPGDQGTCHRDA